jgi:hypothetical protein
LGIDTLIAKITKDDVERFHARLGSVNAKGKKTPISIATINRRMACLNHFFHKAEDWSLIAFNPARRATLRKENNRLSKRLGKRWRQNRKRLTKQPDYPQLTPKHGFGGQTMRTRKALSGLFGRGCLVELVRIELTTS